MTSSGSRRRPTPRPEPLGARVLLLLRGEERAFERLPARGRKVTLRAGAELPCRVEAALALGGGSEQTG